MNILIIDDSEAMQRIERYAVLSGFPTATVKFAANGKAALSLLEQWQPDVIVADYHLPGMDGFQLLLTVRRRYPAVPIGFATADHSTDVEQRVRAAGAAFFVRIPFNYELLVAAISQAIALPAVAAVGAVANGGTS